MEGRELPDTAVGTAVVDRIAIAGAFVCPETAVDTAVEKGTALWFAAYNSRVSPVGGAPSERYAWPREYRMPGACVPGPDTARPAKRVIHKRAMKGPTRKTELLIECSLG